MVWLLNGNESLKGLLKEDGETVKTLRELFISFFMLKSEGQLLVPEMLLSGKAWEELNKRGKFSGQCTD